MKTSEKYTYEHVFYKKAVLKNFAIFTEKHLCWSLFFKKKNAETSLKICSNAGVAL